MATTESAAAHIDDARCADLVLGLLPDAERAAWLEHAALCAACEARLRSHAGASFRAAADWRDKRRESVTPIAAAAKPRARFTPMIAWAAAAALALAVALPLLLRHSAPETGAPAMPVPGDAVSTRAGDGEDAHLSAGIDAYASRDFVTARRELEAARVSGPPEQMRRLYLAQVLVELNRPGEALELLRSLTWVSIPEPYRHDAALLFARALRLGGDAASADSVERSLKTQAPGTSFTP